MYKYKLLFSFVFFFASISLHAQDFDLQWSNLIEKDSKKDRLGDIDYIMSDPLHHYFLIHQGSKKPIKYLYTLDQKLNVVSKHEVDLTINGKDEVVYDKALSLNGKMYIQSSFYNDSKDMKYGFISELSKDGVLSKDLIELDAMSQEKKRDGGFFTFDIADDSSKVLVGRITPYKKNEQETYALRVLDSNFKEIWKKEVALPYKDKIFRIEDYNLDNEGNVFLCGRLYEGKNETKESSDDYAYKIFMYSKNSELAKEYTIDLGESYPTDVIMKFNKDYLVSTGIYSDQETRNDAGVFHIELNKDNASVHKLIKEEFSQDLKDEYRTEKQIKKDKQEDRGVPNYEVRTIYLAENGERVMIAEQYRFYVTTHTVTSVGANGATSTRTVTTYHYVYGDILVSRFGIDGEVKWITKVDKYQHTTNDGGYLSSYISKMHDDGDKIDLIFAEVQPKKESDSKKMEDRFLTKVVTIDKDGAQSETALFTIKDEETIFRAKASVVLDQNRTLILGERKLDFKFGLLNYK